MSYGYKTSLKLGTEKHDVKVVSYAFDRAIDENGDVSSPVEGGTIFLSLADIPKDSILKWGIEHKSGDSFKNGIIETISIENESSVVAEEIEFKNAACTNLKIIYEREHSNYFTTLLTISPQNICIGRNSCWVNKNWTIEEKEETKKQSLVTPEEVKDIIFPKDAAIDGTLLVMGKEYEIQVFETEFIQEDDYKGQPQHEVKGGLMMVTLTQTSDDILNNWMFEKGVAYDGIISFAPVSRSANAPLKFVFTKGRCISFDKMSGQNIGIRLSLLISAEEIKVNEIKHTNKFVFAK